jgi:Transglutaminase-like superfamily
MPLAQTIRLPPEDHVVSYFGKDDPRLEDIRERAQDAARDEDWAGLRAMETELRTDRAFWTGIWAPISSYAAWNQGEGNARGLLEEAIAGGFDGSGELGGFVAEAFGGDADWPDLVDAMRANVAAPSIEILDWPTSRPTRPIRLFRLGEDREALLRERIPEPENTAWETATRLLGWVAGRWKHANAHVDEQDALEILKLVDDGGRFACVEYSTVLGQALNASAIPARVVKLYADDYHVGLGKGHVVAEAWIDGLDAWVLLDGQNGIYWADEDGIPLGVPALQEWFRTGRERAAHVELGPASVSDRDAELWWRYFAHASPTGATWSEEVFVPIFQTEAVFGAEILLRDRAEAYPDLAEIAIGVTSVDGGPAIRPRTEHPFGTGFQIALNEAAPVAIAINDAWALPSEPTGVHEARIATVTSYGALRPAAVAYRVNSAPQPADETTG